MIVAVACDHRGFPLKSLVVDVVRGAGHDVLDLGTHSDAAVDYPDFAAAAGRAIQERRAERAIVLCGSGVGAAVAANKLAGIRAGVCHDTYSAHQAVEHDDVNVLALGTGVVGATLATELVQTFLAARFTRDARHVRRLEKVTALERSPGGPTRS